MVVANDRCNLFVVGDVSEDSLADNWMLLHLAPFIQGQRSWLFEKPSSQPNFSNVMYEAAQVNEFLLIVGQTHPLRDVTCIDRDRR